MVSRDAAEVALDLQPDHRLAPEPERERVGDRDDLHDARTRRGAAPAGAPRPRRGRPRSPSFVYGSRPSSWSCSMIALSTSSMTTRAVGAGALAASSVSASCGPPRLLRQSRAGPRRGARDSVAERSYHLRIPRVSRRVRTTGSGVAQRSARSARIGELAGVGDQVEAVAGEPAVVATVEVVVGVVAVQRDARAVLEAGQRRRRREPHRVDRAEPGAARRARRASTPTARARSTLSPSVASGERGPPAPSTT